MSDFPEKAEDKVNIIGVVMIGLSTVALLWASIVGLQAYFKNTAGSITDARNAKGASAEVRGLKAKQLADLAKTEYADPGKGTLKHLNIDAAMKAVLRDAQNGAPSLIPALGPLNVPTVPAIFGKPAADAKVTPAAPADGTVAPADGTAAPADGTAAPADGTAAPADGTAAPADGTAAPADGTAAPAAPAAEVPAAPQPEGTTP